MTYRVLAVSGKRNVSSNRAFLGGIEKRRFRGRRALSDRVRVGDHGASWATCPVSAPVPDALDGSPTCPAWLREISTSIVAGFALTANCSSLFHSCLLL